MFYKIGGYEDVDDEDPSYVSNDRVINVFMPIATQLLQSFLGDTKTITVAEVVDGQKTDYSSGDLYDDRIIALFAVSLADQEYDKIHVDPETGNRRNFNYETGYQLMINRYGVVNKKGAVIPPVQGLQDIAGLQILKIEMDY